MSTHMPGFQSFQAFLHHFVLAKLASSSIKVRHFMDFLQPERISVTVKADLGGCFMNE